MTLKLYNTKTRQKETFKPINPGKVGIYVCGMTVYDDCHIGHGRMLVVFDMMIRYLRSQHYDVTYVRNITDIDDKIIQRANENGEDIQALTERYIERMHEDEKALFNLPPNQEPRATDHIEHMQNVIQKLVDKGHAYVAENDDVYFDIQSFEKYGALSHQDMTHLHAGSRIDVLDVKKNPGDFVLWKSAKPDEPYWDSPWGKGRPGWHIECSAMSMHCLGEHFDIHGGGVDLVFPHHENETAQSEGATGQCFVNYWLHNGHIQVNQEKMSKSLGNFFTVRNVLEKYEGEVVRYFLLASHYRSPIHYTDDNLESAHAALIRFYTAIRDLPDEAEEIPALAGFEKRFCEAMNDDFNTPIALSVLFDLVREINSLRQAGDIEKAAAMAAGLKRLISSLGLLQQDPNTFLQGNTGSEIDSEKIESLIADRNKARADKNWAEADRLRDELLRLDILIEDTPQGTVWRKS